MGLRLRDLTSISCEGPSCGLLHDLLARQEAMKDQYFGDVNDFRKYCLLRHLQGSGFDRIAVAWMLTDDDGGSDGRFRAYLDPTKKASKLRRLDPTLHDALVRMLTENRPAVSLFEVSGALPGAAYHSVSVPDNLHDRDEWRRGLEVAVSGADLVFVDPDNGIEVRSKPIGRVGSSKYVAWGELEAIWGSGASLLVYQHFRREERGGFVRRMAEDLKTRIGVQHVEAFRTPHVLFLLAAQDRHFQAFQAASAPNPDWLKQIDAIGLANSACSRQRRVAE
jgi:hypothetical protein